MLFEAIPGAMDECEAGIFNENKLAVMYDNNNVNVRIEKLQSRGWRKAGDVLRV